MIFYCSLIIVYCSLIIAMAFWNKKIISPDNKYLGLDLSDLSVKVFQLEKKGNIDKIRSYNSKSISPGLIDNGKIINKEKVGLIVKEAVEKSGPKKISSRKVVCSLPESKVFLRIISIPRISEEEAREAVKWEIEASIPLSADQVYYDWQFLDQEDNKQNVLTVAVSKEVVDDLIYVLEYAGLSVYALEMESIASVRSLIPKNASKNESYLIVDMGGDKTSFVITKSNIPHFTSSIPFSADGITDSIAKCLNISKQEAEKIKTLRGIEHFSEDDSIFNSVKPFLENLSVEIEKTLDFYQDMSKIPAKINRIIISGGGANLKGLVPYLTTRLKKEVVLGDPWINLNLGKNLPPVSRENSISYATAVGLAMRETDS